MAKTLFFGGFLGCFVVEYRSGEELLRCRRWGSDDDRMSPALSREVAREVSVKRHNAKRRAVRRAARWVCLTVHFDRHPRWRIRNPLLRAARARVLAEQTQSEDGGNS